MPTLDPPPRIATIADVLATADRPLYSFEFFPPADAAGERVLWQAVRELERLGPDFISVTYGANGSTRDRTITATRKVSQETTLRTMGHLTCVSQPVRNLRRVIGSYADAGIRHILAVRGDPPGGPTAPWQAHPEGLANATELVRLVTSLGDFCVGVAASPDHPDPDLAARILADKAAAGASFAITQMFFDPVGYFDLVERVRALGCALPIIPGIMPVTNQGQIKRFADMSGAPLPGELVRRLNAVGDDPDEVRSVGISAATDLCEELLDGGAPGLHFFTLNRSRATRAIYAKLQVSRSLSHPA
jgi:methylenetetrahydrofolate reductase (NADPH)